MEGGLVASEGHGWALAVFPLGAGVIALVFALVLVRRVAAKARAHEAVWTLALLMYSAASFSMFLGVIGGWTRLDFEVYWLFGAILNVPYLALGELYLLSRNRALGHGVFVALLALSVFAAREVWAAPLDPTPLAKALPLGKEVFGDGSVPYRLSQLYAFPASFFLLGGTVWSAWRMRGRPDLRDRTAGTVGIAVGAAIVAVGSGIGAGFEVVPLFSVSLAAGIAVMFWGFVRASRRHAPVPATGSESPD